MYVLFRFKNFFLTIIFLEAKFGTVFDAFHFMTLSKAFGCSTFVCSDLPIRNQSSKAKVELKTLNQVKRKKNISCVSMLLSTNEKL